MAELTDEQKKAALSPPPSRPERPRAERRTPGQPRPTPQTPPVGQAPLRAVPARTARDDTGPAPTAPTPHQRIALRTAEQSFLPLASKLAKLAAAVEEAELTVDQALAANVDREDLELGFRQIARKAGLPWGAVPESIRLRLLNPADDQDEPHD